VADCGKILANYELQPNHPMGTLQKIKALHFFVLLGLAFCSAFEMRMNY